MDFNQMMSELSSNPWMRQVVILGVAILLAILVRLLFVRVIMVFAKRTKTDLDNEIARQLRGPITNTIIIVGVLLAYHEFGAPERVNYIVDGVLQSVMAVMWSIALARVGWLFLEVVSENVDRVQFIEPKTLPLFDMVLKMVLISGVLYAICLAWNIPLTSWLASAGVVGIAVGFAAKDTLSNLFSGIFIVADTPYKVGDFVVLDNNIRGEVVEIGMRSTRVLSRDDIEITVPNSVIGNAHIINQTGGPHEKMRVRVKVEAAYGSEVDQVEEVLLACVAGVDHVTTEPAPRVRFRAFGASGLVFELLAWIEKPVYRGRVLHALNRSVYNGLRSAGIEIPYAKQDIYIKEMPGASE